jgi:3-hydroxybutyryl-CoA dehydratase
MAVDPVCGIHVDEDAAQPTEEFTTDYEGQKFYFCSEDCKQVFEEAPAQYAQKPA